MTETRSLKEVRRDQVLSIQELADMAGVSYQTVRNIERGDFTKLHMRTIRSIAQALDVDARSVTEFAAALED